MEEGKDNKMTQATFRLLRRDTIWSQGACGGIKDKELQVF